MQNVKRKTLRNKKTNMLPFRGEDEIKRAVCGHAIIDDNEVLLITIVTPGNQDIMWILDKSMCSDMELIDTLGDKINELKKDGFEIDYRYNKKLTIKTK